MKLKKFMVTNFRSIEESGWIEVDNVTALIGVNESGKTNLLLPLWKLNPAREGEIQPTSDYPKKKFGEIRDNPGEYAFITADFELGDRAADIAELTGTKVDEVSEVRVQRYFDGKYSISFPQYRPKLAVEADEIIALLEAAAQDVRALGALKQEEALKDTLVEAISQAIEGFQAHATLRSKEIEGAADALKHLLPEAPAKTSTIIPRVQQIVEELQQHVRILNSPSPEGMDGVFDAVINHLPKFVYYSNYGNLDSEIYLPHVVQNLERKDLGAKEAAKARTLRVLFKFVRLQPREILELGRDFKDPQNPNREPTPQEIASIAEKKRERSILLQSAGTTLTSRFKDWWKQGDYRFRFEADGNHFRIWVSDDRRPEEVELESRSTGLQWFLSFYLVFLVESQGEHERAILLLDEPGLSLHPLAQRNLSAFFDGLASTNQILYTTHSPFLVDADRLDRARKVYVSEDGTTKVTADLRYGGADPGQAGAAYAVHSALNLSVAESLLLGCQPVIVEGASDQHYLTAIKALLIGAEKIAPKRELVFPPSGGTKTARTVASILTGRDEKLPVMLLDGDESGQRMARELSTSLYSATPEKILSINDYAGFTGAEIEDLFPTAFIARVLDRWQRSPEQPFGDVAEDGKPIMGQIEAWAKTQDLRLPNGWKVELAKRTKQLALSKGITEFQDEIVERWIKLFNALIENGD